MITVFFLTHHFRQHTFANVILLIATFLNHFDIVFYYYINLTLKNPLLGNVVKKLWKSIIKFSRVEPCTQGSEVRPHLTDRSV